MILLIKSQLCSRFYQEPYFAILFPILLISHHPYCSVADPGDNGGTVLGDSHEGEKKMNRYKIPEVYFAGVQKPEAKTKLGPGAIQGK